MTTVYLVEITEQPIELYKLLKIADLVSGGGEAKVLISEGYVLLNNEVEFQKRKKVYDGDFIQLGDNIIEVQFTGELPETTQETFDEREGADDYPFVQPLGDYQEALNQPSPQPRVASKKDNAKSASNKRLGGSNKTKNSAKKSTKDAKKKPKPTSSQSGKRRAISF